MGYNTAWPVLSTTMVGPTPPGPGRTLPRLAIRGHCFVQDDGTPYTAIQCSDFDLLNRAQHGENIGPILAQRQALGFNMLRVWTAYDIPNIGTFLDIDYTRIPIFVGLCATYGLYVEFCAYTGINDPAHWPQLCDAARACEPPPLLELVNELDQNTNEPDPAGRVFHLEDYTKPEGLITCRGSNGSEHYPVGTIWDEAHQTILGREYWDYCTMHFNDAFEWQRKVGHNAMEIWSGPTLSNENSRYCDKQTSLPLAFDAAAGAALLCAGSCFHSVAGKISAIWESDEADAAAQWAAGARSVNLDYQDGQYKHPIELETPDLLRVYQRWYPDERGTFTVTIRKDAHQTTAARMV